MVSTNQEIPPILKDLALDSASKRATFYDSRFFKLLIWWILTSATLAITAIPLLQGIFFHMNYFILICMCPVPGGALLLAMFRASFSRV